MNNTISVTFPVPPDVAIPATLQLVFLYATIAAVAGLVIGAAVMARRYRSAVPLLMVPAAFATIVLEPIVTFLGHAVHPAPGQIMLFESVNRAIPWHIALGYTAGFGLFYLIFYPKMVANSFTTRFIWKATLITAVCFCLGEAYPVSHGLWVYYDYQPLWIWKGTAPPTWNILDAVCMLMGATLMAICLPYLKGWKQVLIIPLAPMGTLMGHVGAGFPMFIAMNTDWPTWTIEVSGVITVLLALMLIWICSLLLVQKS